MTAAGLLLAIVCMSIVATAVGLAVAAWGSASPTWGLRIARGTTMTVGVALLMLAAFHPIAEALP